MMFVDCVNLYRIDISEDSNKPVPHCAYAGGGHIFGVKILNFNIFGGFQKNKYFFLGVMILWIFFGDNHKIGLYLGGQYAF